eukprot:g5624.t1
MCFSRLQASRNTLWITWFVVTIVAAVYVALSLRTFAKVNKAYSDATDADNQTVAVLVAAFAGASIVVVFSVFSFLLLLTKQISTSQVGFTYGFLNATALNQVVICLLCGLVLSAFQDDMETGFSKTADGGYSWSGTDTDVFKSTYWFAFISALGYFVLFLVMFSASFTINREHSLLIEEDKD